MKIDKIKSRLKKVNIALNKSIELLEYTEKYDLGELKIAHGTDLDSALYYDVFLALKEEKESLEKQIEEIESSSIIGLESEVK